MDNLAKNLISIRKAAEFLGISIATLRRWHNEGTFKASFVSPGGHRYYSIADLEKKTKGLFRVAQEWVSSEKSYTPESDFYCATSDRFKTRYERMVHALNAQPALQAVASFISSAAGEIGNNSYDHNLGNWPDVIGAFFAYDIGKRVIVLADRGVGILTTLRRVRSDLQTDAQALEVAFTEFVSGRAPEHRGNGLKYVREALSRVGADLSFQSGNALLELRNGQVEFTIKKTETPIHGCLSRISF